MKKILLLYCKIFVLMLCFFCYAIHLTAQQPKKFVVNNRKVNVKALNKKINALMKDIGIPALSLAVIDQGSVVYNAAYGFKNLSTANKQAADTATIFEACSLSKTFIVYAAYQLVDKGVLDLDKPLYQYYDYPLLRHDDRYRQITARMVLSHSSGIENHIDMNQPDILEILRNPGKSYMYSGEGYIYLAKVLSILVQKPEDQMLKDLVYTPLGLRRTFTLCNDEANRNYASPHDAFGKKFDKERNTYLDLAGRIHTNAGDYGRLLAAIVDGKHISSKGFQEILKSLVAVEEGSDYFYGAGFSILFTKDKDTILLQGGDNNGYKGLACYSIVHKTGFVFFANAERSDVVGKKLCLLTAGIDLDLFYKDVQRNPYPSTSSLLFKIYKKKGADALRQKFGDYIKKNSTHSITENDIIELCFFFQGKEHAVAKYMANAFHQRYPDFLGDGDYRALLTK